MPVFNGAAYLEQCIASVVAQTFGDFELLIADDGSTDASLKIIQGFSDPRIRLLSPLPRQRLFGNLNRLIRESRAPLVHIFCQDDLMEPDCIDEVLQFMSRHPSAGMMFSKSEPSTAAATFFRYATLGDLPELMPPMLTLQNLYYHGCIASNLSTVCVRRSCLGEGGLFDVSYGVSADYEMWCGDSDGVRISAYVISILLEFGLIKSSSALRKAPNSSS